MNKLNIFWFRRDLRLADNHGLSLALASELRILPIFIFDKNILCKLPSTTDKRVDLIIQILDSLNSNFTHERKICYFHGNPVDIFSILASKYEIDTVYANEDYEPYAIARDKDVETLLEEKGIKFISSKDQTIFDKKDILKSDGKPFTVFTPYSRVWRERFEPTKIKPFFSDLKVDRIFPTPKYNNPNLNDIGFLKTGITFVQPEIDLGIISGYEDTRNIPALKGTSGLSLHLRFGTMSIREILRKTYTFSVFQSELIWRDFFMQILFNFPHVEEKAFRDIYHNFVWKNDEIQFQRWCDGTTGFPLVDAGMRELNETGFMHNRVRMLVASFLVKDLQIDWKWGEAYFAGKLLDFDLALNNGNWQWAAGTGTDSAPYFRVFNPTTQLDKFDKNRIYVKKWIPEFGTHLYPSPILDHDNARKEFLDKMKDIR